MNKNKPKLLIIAGDFVEDYELMVPFQSLQVLGFEVDVVCPDKKKGDKIKTAVHQRKEDTQTYVENAGHMFTLNSTFADVNPDDYMGLIVPGGRAPEYLRQNKTVIELIDKFKDKPIACICHGIQLLVATNMLKGKRVTCYPGCKPEVEMVGGQFVDCNVDEAIVDGNLVTAQNYFGHVEWLKSFYKVIMVPH